MALGEGVSALKKKKKVSLERYRYSQMGVSVVSADSLLLVSLRSYFYFLIKKKGVVSLQKN